MAGAESGRTEQIVTNFLLKVLQAVLDSRVPHVLVGGRVGGGDRARKQDWWFNLLLGDRPAALESLSFWHRGVADPMVVDVLLLRDGVDSDAVIERWAVHYEPSASSSRPCTPSSSPSTPFRSAPSYPASAEAAAAFYKKCIVLLRSIYAMLRLLPAYKASRMLSSTTTGSSHHHHHHHHHHHQNCNFNLSYRVSSFAEPFTRAEEEEMRRHDFGAVETQFGQIIASVTYRPDLSEFNLESSSLFPPRIISDYVGSPAADPLRALPSSPSSDAHPTSFPARGIIQVGSGPLAGPFSRPHSWTTTQLAHHPLSTSPPSVAPDSQNSPIGVFGQRTVGGHQRPAASRKGSMSFDDYALSPPFSPSPSPSPPTHSGNPLHRRLRSETAPMSIPSPAMGSIPAHHRSPNLSDPTKTYLLPPSAKVTRADTSFQESPESRSFRRVEGFKVGELSSLQKGIRDVRDDSGRFSGVPSSCGSPRVGFSRSSSKLSFQDDLDDSCPFAVDDIPDSQLSCSTGQEGLKRVHEGERYTSQELHGEKQHESIVSQRKMKGKGKLQEGGISISKDEGLKSVPVGEREELRNNIDSLVNVQGMEDTLSTIKKHLKNDEVDVIKIHGVGGVGKTTILKKLCEDLHTEQEFDFKVVIMVTASKYFQHNMKMQKDIGEQLGLSLFARGPSFLQDKQANILCHALSKKMPFLLLLDGAREIEWEKIGIPPPKKENGCKIIIATDVIKDMENMEIVKVSSLDEDESKKLFLGIVQEKVVINNQQLKDHLADKVFDKCNGLPLALIVVGQAMSFNREEEGWLDDIDKLDGLAKDLHGGEQSVHCAIKFSYDKLKDDKLRFCLLYCSLFPEYHNISVEEIIQYWFGEGLLHDDIDSARNKGHDVIRQLKAVSLLEDGRDIGNEVKMHDVIRDVALQLTSNSHGKSNLFIVHAGSDSKHAPEDEEWRQATRVSLMYSKVEALPCKILKCPDLSTLLINNNISLKQIPRNFFKHMPALRVLDLSSTGINKLPRAIGLLTMLQFLNLSKTRIISLPEELGKLLQLRQLDLSYMPSLSNIPRKAILKLSKLQALNLNGTTHWCIQGLGHGKQKGACIQDLENLVQLKDLRLTITSVSPLQKLQSCPNLLKSSRLLGLDKIQDLSTDLISDIFEKLENLQVLQIAEASCLKELQFLKNCLQGLGFLSLKNLSQTTFIVEASFQKLRHLHIMGCHGFKDLLWACRLPFLECLELRVCYGIEVLITDNDRVKEEVISTFPMLKTMLLLGLPMLERISSSSLSLPSLEYLEVFYCPKLKKLPLTAQSAKKIKEICGRKEWWDGLEWYPESVKMNLLHLFKDLRNHKEMTVKHY